MKTQFTPGPWRVMQDPFKNTVCINSPAHNNMVAVSGLNRDATAALIAAAPDMFEALENLLDWAEHAARCSSNDECFGCYDDEEFIQARAALQKAKGGKL